MNKEKIKKYRCLSILLTFVLGTLLHFTYEWSNENQIVGIFSAINESVWEHLKLLYFPMLITIIIGYFYIKRDAPNFLCTKTIGILISMMFTVVFFYTYTGILGKNYAFIDISSFFIATILGEYAAYLLMINKFSCNKKCGIIVLIIIGICFILFTYNPPRIGLFKDPITGGYGETY